MQNSKGSFGKPQVWSWILCFYLFLAFSCIAQTLPPNDNYSNRIVLNGTDITFGGSLAGATLEDAREANEYNTYYPYGSGPATQSIWWTWTAPASGALTFQMLNSSLGNSPNQFGAGLTVYQATNNSTSPDGLAVPPLGFELVDFRIALQTLSIPVVAGSNYQIQLVGSNSAIYTFRMVVTNTPVIIQPPRSQTVYSNASALFYVIAAGLGQTNFTFQWLFNGAALAGETAPMLALTNIDSTMAGEYSVIVSNGALFTVSPSANLSVSRSNVPISLTALGIASNTFVFSLVGESNRNYRIESSTDLMNWTNAVDFVISPCVPNSTSVVFKTNSSLVLNVTNGWPRTFFRATPYVLVNSNAEICVNNLRKIRVAKLLWQRDYGQAYYSAPTHFNLDHYFPHGQEPYCPLDLTKTILTSYSLDNLTTSPVCEIQEFLHVLEDPQ